MSRALDEARPCDQSPAPMKQFRGFPASQPTEIGRASGALSAD